MTVPDGEGSGRSPASHPEPVELDRHVGFARERPDAGPPACERVCAPVNVGLCTSLSELRWLLGCSQLPEGGLCVLDELVVVVLVSPGDGGEGVQGAEVLKRFGVGVGEVAPVPVQERVLEAGAVWPYAEAEAYEIVERDVGAGVLEVNEVEVCGWAEEPAAGPRSRVLVSSARALRRGQVGQPGPGLAPVDGGRERRRIRPDRPDLLGWLSTARRVHAQPVVAAPGHQFCCRHDDVPRPALGVGRSLTQELSPPVLAPLACNGGPRPAVAGQRRCGTRCSCYCM
jgi:hypothetical protein